ncbi:hypothetical protein PHJA_002921100, partial [Phtheirospermum japonicum]
GRSRDYSPLRNSRFAEVAGGTAAECAAVCCCCPCGLVDLLVLAVYKLPAGLCPEGAEKKRPRRLVKMGLLPPAEVGCDEKGDAYPRRDANGPPWSALWRRIRRLSSLIGDDGEVLRRWFLAELLPEKRS